jgi:hypothetical protein
LNIHYKKLKIIVSKSEKILFFIFKKFQYLLTFPKKKRILFSIREDWVEHIKNGLKFTNCVVTFGEFSKENIINNDIIVPLTIKDTLYLDKVKDLVKYNPLPIPKKESTLLCDNKLLLNQKLISSGFGKYVPEITGDIPYPYILKKSIDAFGKNSHIIFNSLDEKKLSKIILNSNYFKQKFISGPNEYATHILFKNHKIYDALTIKYFFEKEFPIKGKDRIIYTGICKCPYLDLFSSILESIGFEGICCINYKISNNQPKILEINTRFGGSLTPFFVAFLRNLK